MRIEEEIEFYEMLDQAQWESVVGTLVALFGAGVCLYLAFQLVGR